MGNITNLEIDAKIDKILLPKDYIRHKLSGEFATEASDASGMLSLDVAHRCWCDELLSKPTLIRTGWLLLTSPRSSALSSTRKPRRWTGLKAGTPIAGGAGDQGPPALVATVSSAKALTPRRPVSPARYFANTDT